MIKLMPDDSYRFIDNLKQDDKTLYAEGGLNVEHFRYLASTLGNNDAASKTLKSATCRMRPRKRLRGVADRRNPSRMNRRRRNADPAARRGARTEDSGAGGRHGEHAACAEAQARRPKGSKNKKTLEREALAAAARGSCPQERAGDGRRARRNEDAGELGYAGGPKQTAPTDEKGVEKD